MSNPAEKRPLPLKALAISIVLIWIIIAAFPFLWTMWGSFKVEGDFFSRSDWMNAVTGPLTQEKHGSTFTMEGYEGAWIEREFYRAVINTAIVTVSVVAVSLTLGTLGGYALARSGYKYSFWLLMMALVFRAMPGVTLISGYMLPFFELNIWGYLPTAIIVLVAMNQPFTLWMLHSFFKSIPRDLDEAALVDGCSRFQAFRLAIIPVMWPGVITTGLFSFLTAYNDFAVTSMLLSEQNLTMIPQINSFLGSSQEEGKVMYAVAAVVSSIVPLFVFIMIFQRRLVSGLTAGAVKG
ncbi:carbohydrate ABC transporter permease [Maritimibacter fusiformis]|uniref:Carbohydrate ABC transporter permease n=1 Tax=Maritimibacter fusiformis TaxID=2603819 RepID=A0A5D0RS41_9RHOB|nr:carbohydrate ABC transporter permease [Maritimibacter fusiformis]TYB83424.1 carbohydrate ABC transporter permease [Maritimibacter fusiformis]